MREKTVGGKRPQRSSASFLTGIDNLRLNISRVVSRAPRPVKTLLRPLRRIGQKTEPVELEGWDWPIIGNSPSTPLSWPASNHSDGCESIDPSRLHLKRCDLRCLLVTESLDASGVDEFVAFLARRLPKQGIEAAVLLVADIVGWRDGRLASALRDEGISVFSGTASDGAAIVAKWAPDVVYSHGASMWPLTVAKDMGLPTLEALHGMHNVFNRTQPEFAARRALIDKIVAVSELVRRQYLALDARTPADKVLTIPNGIDRSRAAPIDRRAARNALGLDDRFVFVSLARHTIQKNTYALADAFLEMAPRYPSAHLLICGRPDDEQYTRQVVRLREQALAGNRLHLRDNVHRVDVLLAAADAFVLDSFFEGWSLASMEALGVGIPVLLSDVGGAREQLNGGVSKGLLINNPLGDPLLVNWRTSFQARFAKQENRDELMTALSAFVRGDLDLASREHIREDSLARFSDDVCLLAHAKAIREVARANIDEHVIPSERNKA